MITKFLTVEDQQKKVAERIARYQTEYDIVSKVLPLLEKYHGKRITKHIATHVKKSITNYSYWMFQYGMFQIDICYGEKYNYNNHVSVLLGYESSPILDIEKVREYNRGYLLHKERIEKLKRGVSRIPELIQKRDRAIQLLDELDTEAEEYEMTYDFKLSD